MHRAHILLLLPLRLTHSRGMLVQGKTVAVVTSGANMNFDRLRLVAELAGVGARQEAMLITTIPERPGSFHAFARVALMQTDIQVTEFKYRCAVCVSSSPLHQHAFKRSCAASAFVSCNQRPCSGACSSLMQADRPCMICLC